MLKNYKPIKAGAPLSTDPVAVVDDTAGLEPMEDGSVSFRFQTVQGAANRGKGIHRWPLDQAPEILETLQELISTSPAVDDDSVAGKIRSTWKTVQEDDGEFYHTYKLDDGPGSKACRIPVNRASEILALLVKKLANVDSVLPEVQAAQGQDVDPDAPDAENDSADEPSAS